MKYTVNEKGEIINISEYDEMGEVLNMGEAPFDYEFGCDPQMGLSFPSFISDAVSTVSSTASSALSKFGDITGINKAADKLLSDRDKANISAAIAKAQEQTNKAATSATLDQLAKVRQQIADTEAGRTIADKVPGASKILGPTSDMPVQGNPQAEAAAAAAKAAEEAANQAAANSAKANLLNAQSAAEKEAAMKQLAEAMNKLTKAQAIKAINDINAMPEPKRSEILAGLEKYGFSMSKFEKSTWIWWVGGLGVAAIITTVILKKKGKLPMTKAIKNSQSKTGIKKP